MYDVKEIAKRLDVTKKTVYKYLKKHDEVLKPYCSKGNKNQKVLSQKGYDLLLELINNENDNIKSHDYKGKYIELLEQKINDLQQDKEYLKKQNDKLVSDLSKFADQQQQLQLDLQKKIKLLDVDDNSHKENNQSDVSQEENQQSEPKGLLEKLKDLFVTK